MYNACIWLNKQRIEFVIQWSTALSPCPTRSSLIPSGSLIHPTKTHTTGYLSQPASYPTRLSLSLFTQLALGPTPPGSFSSLHLTLSQPLGSLPNSAPPTLSLIPPVSSRLSSSHGSLPYVTDSLPTPPALSQTCFSSHPTRLSYYLRRENYIYFTSLAFIKHQ